MRGSHLQLSWLSHFLRAPRSPSRNISGIIFLSSHTIADMLRPMMQYLAMLSHPLKWRGRNTPYFHRPRVGSGADEASLTPHRRGNYWSRGRYHDVQIADAFSPSPFPLCFPDVKSGYKIRRDGQTAKQYHKCKEKTSKRNKVVT